MKCSFCNKRIKPGSGKMFVKNTGEIVYFCSSKCQKSYNLGRKKLKWAKKEK
jgi:large subunit ribosomal protein L24e